MHHRRWSASTLPHSPVAIVKVGHLHLTSMCGFLHLGGFILGLPSPSLPRSFQISSGMLLPDPHWGGCPFPLYSKDTCTPFCLVCMRQCLSHRVQCSLNRLNIFSDEWTNIVTPVLVFSLYLEWDLRRCLTPVCRLDSTWQLKVHSRIQVICFCKVYMNESKRIGDIQWFSTGDGTVPLGVGILESIWHLWSSQ